MHGSDFPLFGIAIALAGGVTVAIIGGSFWLGVGIAILWIGSLWLGAKGPQFETVPETNMQLNESSITTMIENSAIPMMLVDRNRIIVANAQARDVLGHHIIGQDARVALRHPDAVKLLDRQGGGSATITGLKGPRTVWQMTRNPFGDRYATIELLNRTAEADIARAHTDFVANASHELRTPLASIIGYIETLSDEDNAVDRKTAARFYATVLREARRLQHLVSDLMSLSRIEAEKHDQPVERIELHALVAKAALDAAPEEEKARVALAPAPADPIIVLGDPQQLEQVVRNLVENALKYGHRDAKVDVLVDPVSGGRAQIEVRDRGEGITREHLPHLTRRFYRTDPGRSRQQGGTGLGLAIVKHIVERHRGRFDIESEVGKGTTVRVSLPMVGDAQD
jgi:two-component system phosphate regulon sensor histidine kinase PhoR